MGRYRKVDSRIWNDEKFRALSDDGQLLFLFLMTHPHMTSLGAMRNTAPGLAAEKGWPEKRLSKALQEILVKQMAEFEPGSAFISLPHFLRYNPPESPNVVKSWLTVLDLLPECAARSRVIQRTAAFCVSLPEGFTKELPEAFRMDSGSLTEDLTKGFRIQEQDPDPEPIQEPIQEKETPLIPLRGKFGNVRLAEAEFLELNMQFGESGAKERIEALSEYMASKNKQYRNHYATILSWERRNGTDRKNGQGHTGTTFTASRSGQARPYIPKQ